MSNFEHQCKVLKQELEKLERIKEFKEQELERVRLAKEEELEKLKEYRRETDFYENIQKQNVRLTQEINQVKEKNEALLSQLKNEKERLEETAHAKDEISDKLTKLQNQSLISRIFNR
ncbi:hypothetical protein RyT2_14130 [Pseudolactococcus yaeyamensis]